MSDNELSPARRAAALKAEADWAWSGRGLPQDVTIGEMRPADAARAAWLEQERRLMLLEERMMGALAFIATYQISDPSTPAAVLLSGLQRVAATGLGKAPADLERDRAEASSAVERAFALDAERNGGK